MTGKPHACRLQTGGVSGRGGRCGRGTPQASAILSRGYLSTDGGGEGAARERRTDGGWEDRRVEGLGARRARVTSGR